MFHKVHSSWLIALASISVLVGAFLGQFYQFYSSAGWLLIGISLFISGFFSKRQLLGVVLVISAGLIIGLQRGGMQAQQQARLQIFIGETVELSGRVAEDPSLDADGDLRFRLRDIAVDGELYSGEVWVSTNQQVPLKRSDNVLITGLVSKGFGTIPAAVYRASIVEISREDYSDVARDTRDWFAENIREGIREPEASLGSGFLLGQKSALPEKLDIELRLLGLTHIVVASGYNLSILVRYGRRLFERISRFSAVALSGILVFCFANITGFSPSMTRASLITGLSLLAWYYGRKFHPVVLLSFSAAITILINPTYIWGDLGWLLSFSSFVGVIMLSPLIHKYFWGEEKPGDVRQVVIETFSAQVLTLPLIMLTFGQYSPLALVANALILPFIPLAMLLTFIAGITAVILPSWISEVIAWPAETLMGYMTGVVDYLASQPIAAREISLTLSEAIAAYFFITITVIYLWRRTGHRFHDYNIVE